MLVLVVVLLQVATVSAAVGEPQNPSFHPDRVILVPKKGVAAEALQEAHLKSGRRLLKRFPQMDGIEVVQLAPGENVPEAILRLKKTGLFAVVEPDFKLRAHIIPNDPEFGIQWSLRNTGQSGGLVNTDISAVKGWDTLRSATNIVVAVIDSGIRYTHEDLAANLWVNEGEIPGNGLDDDANGVVDDVHGYNAIYVSGDVMDDNGHGSHVAGIVGAVGNNGKGISGVAWGVKLMGCKFLDNLGDGSTSDAIACIDYARRQGAHIINCSFGGDQYSSAFYMALSNVRRAGIIVVAAAGNSSRNIDLLPNYPASFDLDNIVSVCAINRHNTLDTGYSNYGAFSVDLAAPGQNIYSTWHSSDKGYNYSSGTSMAAPLVSGAFALLKARYPNENSSQLISRMLQSVDPVAGLAGKCVTGGRMNLAKALGPHLLADFEASVALGSAPLSVQFTNRSFGQVEQYVWDFGDGSDLVYERDPIHVFAEPGEHTVTLKLVGPNSSSHTMQTVVRVVRNYEFVPAPFDWFEITSGQEHSLSDNGFTGPVEIGFPFTFYGQDYSTLHVAANGLIGFSTAGLDADLNGYFPNALMPNALIAPYWDDLDPSSSGGGVYTETVGEAPDRKLVISWVDIPKSTSGARLTFQAVLEEGTNELLFQYLQVQPLDTSAGGNSATIGLQNETGEIGVVHAINGDPLLLQNQQALRAKLFEYSFLAVNASCLAPFAHVATEPLEPQSRTITIRNSGTVPLEWRALSMTNWCAVSPENGILAPGAQAEVALSLTVAVEDLQAGEHGYEVLFENLRDGQGTRFLGSTMNVLPPAPVLTLLTNSLPQFTGGLGGPFTPESWSCTVSNSGNASLHWEIVATEVWVLPPPSFPVLAPGESSVVEVHLSPLAEALLSGVHDAALQFVNLDTAAGSTALPLSVNVRSGLQSSTAGQVDSGAFKLSIHADPGTTQVIETSLDLFQWSPVYTNTLDADGTFELWFPTSAQSREFFRVRELH